MDDVNALPEIDYDVCIACGQCIGICPGLAIFMAKIVGEKVHLSLPYEFHPIPRVGDRVVALDRSGNAMDDALVKRVVKKGKTMVVTIEIANDLAMVVRNIRV
jgi:Fe-S-cluster-containing hydrogenase component 2